MHTIIIMSNKSICMRFCVLLDHLFFSWIVVKIQNERKSDAQILLIALRVSQQRNGVKKRRNTGERREKKRRENAILWVYICVFMPWSHKGQHPYDTHTHTRKEIIAEKREKKRHCNEFAVCCRLLCMFFFSFSIILACFVFQLHVHCLWLYRFVCVCVIWNLNTFPFPLACIRHWIHSNCFTAYINAKLGWFCFHLLTFLSSPDATTKGKMWIRISFWNYA